MAKFPKLNLDLPPPYLALGLGLIALGGYYFFVSKGAGGPRSTVTPSSGGPGTSFALSGSGFPASTQQFFQVVGPSGAIIFPDFPVNMSNSGDFSGVSLPYSSSGGVGTYRVEWVNFSGANTTYQQV